MMLLLKDDISTQHGIQWKCCLYYNLPLLLDYIYVYGNEINFVVEHVMNTCAVHDIHWFCVNVSRNQIGR